MKKYIVTEDELYEMGNDEWEGLAELPPGAKVLTREQVRDAIDEPGSTHEQRVLYQLFGDAE